MYLYKVISKRDIKIAFFLQIDYTHNDIMMDSISLSLCTLPALFSEIFFAHSMYNTFAKYKII